MATYQGTAGNDALNSSTGLISGTAPGATTVHHISVTATDTHAASASVDFDLGVIIGNTVTANVLTRSGTMLPGVTAYELISNTPTGSLYSFKNIALDTNAVTGIRTLTAEVVTTGSTSDGALGLTFHAGAGSTLQGFDQNGTIFVADNWSIATNTSVANAYGVAASKSGAPVATDTLIGKLTLTLPGTIAGNSILDFTDATLGSASAPGRSLTYSQESLGASGQISTTLPDSTLTLSLSRGTADYLINGTSKPITAADALDALKLSVGLAASKGNSWKELISADITHDGRVTAADALEILKVSVGVHTIQPSWVFVPNDASCNPNLSGMTKSTVTYKDDLNFASITGPASATITGILVGDVNNSWLIPT